TRTPELVAAGAAAALGVLPKIRELGERGAASDVMPKKYNCLRMVVRVRATTCEAYAFGSKRDSSTSRPVLASRARKKTGRFGRNDRFWWAGGVGGKII